MWTRRRIWVQGGRKRLCPGDCRGQAAQANGPAPAPAEGGQKPLRADVLAAARR